MYLKKEKQLQILQWKTSSIKHSGPALRQGELGNSLGPQLEGGPTKNFRFYYAQLWGPPIKCHVQS